MELSKSVELETKPFRFTGSTGEYFRIWIVNVALTLVTLGIYSAWAKVRNKRYFYGNSWLDEHNFEYLADPIKILKGRILAFLVFVLYLAVTSVAPVTAPLFMLAFLIAMPWLVVRSLAFNYQNSSYRNIRFRFTGSYGEAVGPFIGYPMLAVITFGLAYPLAQQKRNLFIFNQSHYGTSPFKLSVGVWPFYKIYLGVVLVLILVGLLFFSGSAVHFAYLRHLGEMPFDPESASSASSGQLFFTI